MKYKFLALLVILCLALCACNNAGGEAPAGGESGTPATNASGEAVPTNSADSPSDPAKDPEPTDKGLFETENEIDPLATLPHSFGSIVLPEDEFGDDIEGIPSSRPLDETIPEGSEPAPTEAPSKPNTNYNPPITLPEDVFDDA